MPGEMLLGSCLEHMGGLADGSINSIITDPPYEANTHKNQIRLRKNPDGSINFSSTDKFELPFSPLTNELRDECSREFVRLSSGWIILFCQQESVGDWKRSLEYAGAIYKRCALWIKPNAQPQMSGDRPGNGAESIVCAWSGKGRSRWNGGGKLGLYYAQHDPVRYHPTQKPLDLMEQLVQDFSNPGELVLDPFAGSGTTGIASLKHGRRFLGIEQDKGFYEAALFRLGGSFADPLHPDQPSLFSSPVQASCKPIREKP